MNENLTESLKNTASPQSTTSQNMNSGSLPDNPQLTESEGNSMLREFLADGDWALSQFEKIV